MSPISSNHSPVVPIATPFDLTDYPELAGISAISGTGLVARTGTGTYATRTIAVPAAGITISNAGGVAGNPTLALANDLAALEALSSTGIAVRSTTDAWVQRTITGTTNQVNVANGDGVSGNPTLSTPQNIHTAATPQFAGIGLGTAYSGGRIQLVSGTTSADGIFWGTDTNLYRDAANSLKTDDSFTVTNMLYGQNFTIGNAGGSYFGLVNSALARVDAHYAIQQSGVGTTIVGAPTGALVRLAVNTVSKAEITGSAITLSVPTTVSDTTASTSSTTGALIVSGGVGIAKALYVANDLVVTPTASANRAVTITGSNGGSPTIGTSGGNLAVSSSTDITGALTVSGNLVISAGAVYSNERLTVRATAAAHHTAAVWQASSNTLHTYLYSDGNVAGYTLTSTSGGAIYMHHLARDAHRFMNNSGEELVRITNTAGATRYMTLTGSNGGNPTIGVSAGNLAITPAVIGAASFTATAFIPSSATVPTNGMYLEAANNPAFAANSTKVFEYDSTGIQIAGTITTTGGATFHTTSTALTNGAGAGAGTLTNAPAAGDPTKWIGINDNGTTRYIPAW